MTYAGNGIQQDIDNTRVDLGEQIDLMKQLSATSTIQTDMTQRARDYQMQNLQPTIDVEASQARALSEQQNKLVHEAEKRKPTVLESVTSMFELENPISAFYVKNKLPITPPMEGYNPLEIEGELEGYEQYASYFADSFHPMVTAAIKGNIDRERYNRDVISRTGTFTNILSGVASGLGDPITLGLLLSGKGAPAAVSRLSTGAKVGIGLGVGVTHTAINEVLLHGMQATRTLDESALNLVASVVLDSAITGIALGAGELSGAKSAVRKYFKDGGRVSLSDPLDTPQVKSMGAAARDIRTGAPEIAEPGGIGKIGLGKWTLGSGTLKMAKITPIGRTMQSNNGAVRQASLDLAENNYMLKGDELGPQAAETLINVDMAKAKAAMIEIENLQTRAKTESGMDETAFNNALDFALRRGDTHENPIVQEAAQRYRAVLKENWDRAAEFNVDSTRRQKIDPDSGQPVLKDGEPVYEAIEQTTAQSYQTRVYDKALIKQDPEAFRATVERGARQSIIDENAKLDSRVATIEAEEGPKMTLTQKAYDDLGAANKGFNKEIKAAPKAIDKLMAQRKKTSTSDIDARERINNQIEDIRVRAREAKAEISANKKLRSAHKKAMTAYKKKIDNIVKQKQALDQDSIEDFAQGFYESVTDLKVGDSHWGVEGKPNIFKPRNPIKDEYLEAFLQKNWEHRLQQQVQTLSPRARLAQKFGGKTGDYKMGETIKNIEAEYKNAIGVMREDAKLTPQQKTKMEKKMRDSMKSELRDLETMRDRLLGRIAGTDPDSPIQSLARANLAFNATRMLNGMMLSSIPEIGKVMARHGVRKTMQAFAKNAKSWRIKDLPTDSAARLASAIQRQQNGRMASMADMIDLTPTRKFEKGANKLAQATNYWSGQQAFDSQFKGISGSLASDGFARAVKSGDAAALRKAGFTQTQMKVAKREMAKHGREVDGLWEPNVDRWDLTSPDNTPGYRPDDLIDAYEAMVIKEANTLIVQPGVGDRPVFMDDMTARTIFQFKSFILGATNRTMVPMMQGKASDALKLISYQTMLGAVAYMAYETGAGREINYDPQKLMQEGLDRGGYVGYAMEMNNMSKSVLGVGLFNDEASRFRSRDAVAALAGPTAGTITDLSRALNMGSDGDKMNVDVDARIHAMRKLLPFQNHWGLRQQLDWAEGEAAKGLGGTGRFGAEDKGKSVFK